MCFALTRALICTGQIQGLFGIIIVCSFKLGLICATAVRALWTDATLKGVHTNPCARSLRAHDFHGYSDLGQFH